MRTLLQRRRPAALRDRAKGVWAFWTKLNNDWVFNLAGLLAYNLLLSLFPILLLLLSVTSISLEALAPGSVRTIVAHIAAALPVSGSADVINSVWEHLRNSAGLVLAIGVIGSVVAGSRLFITLENCLGVVFRLRGRGPIRQNLVAIGMLLLYLVLLPLVMLAFLVPPTLASFVPVEAPGWLDQTVLQVAGAVVSLLAAIVLFGAIYTVVPNRPFRWAAVWRGTLVAAALLVAYEAAFPFYTSAILHPDNYGTIAGFAIVILVFFYYLAFILLLGAEINSWSAGQRQTVADISGVLHAVQAHDTTRGAAGPTAGQPQEHLQRERVRRRH
jgi:membrane protein